MIPARAVGRVVPDRSHDRIVPRHPERVTRLEDEVPIVVPAAVDEVAHLLRSQIAGIIGNVMTVAPVVSDKLAPLQKESGRCLHCDCRKRVSCDLRKWSTVYGADRKKYNTTEDRDYRIIGKGNVLFEPGKCIRCGLCHIACEDTSHQAIAKTRNDGERRYEVIAEECVGCNLCMHVCPVDNCITMKQVDRGLPSVGWVDDPRNPLRRQASK